MPPFRMNLTTVKVRRLLRSSTLTDTEFKEATETKEYSAEEDFRCQVRHKVYDRSNRQMAGNVPFYSTVLCYKLPTDLTKRLQRGDKVTGLPDGRGGYDVVDLVVNEVGPAGHLPGPTIWFAYLGRNEDVVNSV